MNIAVIAAGGRSGRAFVAAALRAGHTIRAGVRSGESFESHEHLIVMQCDATIPEQVRKLLDGADAVVSLIGHVRKSPNNVQTKAIMVIVEEMKRVGMSRIVSLTGTGVRFNGDKITIMDKLLNVSISLIDPARVNDGKRHVEVLQQSGLDWTVVRVLKLQNIQPSKFVLTEHGPTKLYVGRKDVANAIIDVLENGDFIHKAPILSHIGS